MLSNYKTIQAKIGEDHDRVLKLEIETFKHYYEEAKLKTNVNAYWFSKDLVKFMEELIAYDEEWNI